MKKGLLVLSAFLTLLFLSITLQRADLTVIGYVNMAEGLGRQSLELIDALNGDLQIRFLPTKKTILTDVPQRFSPLLRKKADLRAKVVLFEECLHVPGSDHYKPIASPKRPDQIRIAYSMFESSQIPPKWTEILNLYFDAVVVPDSYFIDVYAQSGVKIPIFVLPLGLNLEQFLSQPEHARKEGPFLFANLSSGLDRKNQLLLIRAFAKEFANNPDVRLLINCRYGEQETLSSLRKESRNLGLSNVLFSQLDLDRAAYLALFEKIDCYVSLSKGEGYSIQPREALALAIPVIVTDNTAQSTLCQSGLVRSVLSSKEEPARYWWGATHGKNFLCTEEDAAAAMKEVYRHYAHYQKLAQKGREWVKQCDYSAIKPLYKSLVKPKKVVLGKENRIETNYLMTNSEELYEKYLRLCS